MQFTTKPSNYLWGVGIVATIGLIIFASARI